MNKEGALVKSWTFHVINGGRPNLKAKIKTIKALFKNGVSEYSLNEVSI